MKKRSDLMGDTAYPAEGLQAQVDQEQADDAWNGFSLPNEYQFVYCNPGEAPIWMADLSFRRIDEIAVGDEIIGWKFSGQSMSRRMLCTAAVSEVFERTADVVKVTMESGRTLRCTADHRWLRHWSQRATDKREEFVVPLEGTRLVHVMNPPQRLTQTQEYAALWLGGLFDGEGSASSHQAIRISQCPSYNPEVCAHLIETLTALGLSFTQRGRDIWLTGGRQTLVDFVNWTHPVKWRGIRDRVLGERWQASDQIVSVEPDGSATVFGLTTTTGNYVAWGYASKNCNGQLEVSPAHGHDELADHAGVGPDHHGPLAVGYVTVNDGSANWQVEANVSLNALHRVLKDYCKNVGWRWGGMTSIEGEPISDDFAPKKSKALLDEQTGQQTHFIVRGHTAYTQGMPSAAVEELREAGYRIAEYPGGTNLDPDQPNPFQDSEAPTGDSNMFGAQEDHREPSGLWKCRDCGELLPNWHEYVQHRMREEPIGDPDSKFPELDMDSTFPPHFTEMQPTTQPISAKVYVSYHRGEPVGYVQLNDQAKIARTQGEWRYALAKVVRYTAQEPKDMLDAPIPFIYDIDKDALHTGNPGERTSDVGLPGKFTPGGIVEGFYEPGGKVVVRTMTNMPWSVRHMVELWYYTQPQFTVKSVHLQDAEGKDTKLAAQSIGGQITSLVASDPVAHTAASSLMKAGGNVFVVGGAVRDAVMGKSPQDVDLMVQGLPVDDVRKTLEGLPGRVDLTGKDFGVFRYRHKGDDVEIALPRKERSTGEGHQDFDVTADPYMTPEEDLRRRDFTANAMAVNLRNGRLIDPFGGANDIGTNTLRTVDPNALAEDPLRVLRAVVARAKHGLEPDPQTRQQMAANAASLEHLPPERIQAELDKLMRSDDPAAGIRLAHETGILGNVLPEVENTFGFDQRNPHHAHDLGSHILEVLDGVASQTQDPDARLSALLHDIGKPASQWVGPDGVGHYYRGPGGEGADHDEIGAEQARLRLNQLRYPNDRIDRIANLVKFHMYPDFSSVRGARKFLAQVGPHAEDLMMLRQADREGKGTPAYQATKTPVDRQRALVAQVRAAGDATDRSQLAINGRDLLDAGIQPGPIMTTILDDLTNKVVEDPTLNHRDTLLQLVQENYGSSM